MSASTNARTDLRRAIAELRTIRSDDPAAAFAVAAVRATVHTLESSWFDVGGPTPTPTPPPTVD